MSTSTSVIANVYGHTETVVALYITACPTCSIIHAIPESLKARRRKLGGNVYCPNGHTWIFTELEVDKQRARADNAEAQLHYARAARDAARDQALAAERTATAYKGHLTRMRNRIATGVCPVQGCRRNFANVKAHIMGQHPDWAHEHPEVLA